MTDISFNLSGFPALILLSVLCYIFVYLPLKMITILIAHGKQKADKRQRLQQQTIIAEYKPPEGFTPAELGYMYDTKLNAAEVFATITALEQQGFIETHKTEHSLILSSVKPSTASLNDFEAWLLGFLMPHAGKPITKRLLNKISLEGGRVLDLLLQKRGYFIPSLQQMQKFVVRLLSIMAILMGGTFIIFFPKTWSEVGGILFFLILFAPVYIVITIFLYIKFRKIDGADWLGTPKLKAVWPDIEGYRQFIKLVELDRLRYDTEQTEHKVKNSALPYAIALGFNTGWRKQL